MPFSPACSASNRYLPSLSTYVQCTSRPEFFRVYLAVVFREHAPPHSCSADFLSALPTGFLRLPACCFNEIKSPCRDQCHLVVSTRLVHAAVRGQRSEAGVRFEVVCFTRRIQQPSLRATIDCLSSPVPVLSVDRRRRKGTHESASLSIFFLCRSLRLGKGAHGRGKALAGVAFHGSWWWASCTC